ncbi:MAG: hexose kinase [Planctomycetota bacterium]
MSAPRFVTVTLNPAIDRVWSAPKFQVGSAVRAKLIGSFPAGKGINAAKAFGAIGDRCVATGFVGRNELEAFERVLDRAGRGRVVTQLLSVHGKTRENMTITDPVLDTETHIRDRGFNVARADVRRMLSKVGLLAREDNVVIFGGSAPPGVIPGDIRSMLHRVNEQGAYSVVDTSGPALQIVRRERVWMLKLNLSELAEIAGEVKDEEHALVETCRGLLRQDGGKQGADVVVVTRGPAGAVLVTRDGTSHWARTMVHPGRIVSTVGCGDALLAGLLHEWGRTRDWASAIRRGAAVATANAVGSEPGFVDTQDVSEFWAATTVEAIGG